MSELIITPVVVTAINPHPNADRLEICRVSGWDIVSGKGNYKVGDIVVHIPPEVMVPRDWADKWGVTQYLSFKKDSDMGRVRAARLRSIASFGFLVPNDSGAEPGASLAAHYGIEKYEPPPPPLGMSAGQMRREHPLFHHYTDMQNLRNFPEALNYSIPLVVTEKLHGTNSRVGWVRTPDPENGGMSDYLEKVVGTHRTQRDPNDCGVYGLPFELHAEALDKLLEWAIDAIENPEGGTGCPLNSLIVFGEIYGAGVQDLHYGAKNKKGYRVFDIAINGEYLNHHALTHICNKVRLPLVPFLSGGMLSYETLLEMAQGNTTLEDGHIREGIVVRPMYDELTWSKGELDPHPKRMVFKIISPDYLTRKDGTEYH